VRYLILSDIHANLEALDAVLHHVRRKHFDHILFLGDAVGYGASPNQVVSWLRSLGPGVSAVRGNHDRVCAGLDSGEYFNRYARQASMWTYDRLDPRNLEYLRGLAEGPVTVSSRVAFCHGSTVDEDTYIFSSYDAQIALGALPQEVVFFGHTHVPSMFVLRSSVAGVSLRARLLSGRRVTVELDLADRQLVNPGSVGQPRDRDPRASYAIYDDEQRHLHLYRVVYRVESARRRIIQSGLPPVLGDRLLYGA
jgi:predicted phosphodiesterase